MTNHHSVFVFVYFSDCARDTKIFENNGLSFPLACNGYGNYDPIQNLNGKYFCVDQDGFAVTDYLNITSAIGLDCTQYLYYSVRPVSTTACKLP